jgi:septal ring factor EnvC (AmiA/AmiB activator)
MAPPSRLLALLVLAAVLPLAAQAGARATEAEGATETTGSVGELRRGGEGTQAAPESRKQSREAELEAIRRSIEVSERRQEALRGEIEGLEQDAAGLSADLVATARRMRETEDGAARIEKRLDSLHVEAEALRASLAERRDVMAEVLMALQRMGRTPPPAILSRPEDALAAIRGSILAGAVLPEIRGEAERLAADLGALNDLTAEIEKERDSLRERYASLADEQARINILVDAKKAQREQTEAALGAERDKAAELAGQAKSVEGLIESLEREVAAAARAAEQARQAALNTERADQKEAARRLADTSRIAPAVHFADAKGLLALPVAGERVLGYGDSDGLGGQSQGISLATRPEATVLAPADGWVVYAGPFRSYGQVLILNAGDGYHVVLAGMERIDAALGQFVLGGEPVGAMGATRLASLGDIDHTSAQPILYVEFRKDGNAIDSAPWWASADREVNG